MNSRGLKLCETTDHFAWDLWVDLSPQGTIFSKTVFLRSLNTAFRLFTVVSGQSTVALISVIEDGARNIVQFPFTPYQGILFLSDSRLLQRQRIVEEFRVTTFIIEELAHLYGSIGMSLSWNFEDIRPFLWHNYHEKGAPHFTARAQYTALLDIGAMEPEMYLGQVRACRRQEFKKASKFSIVDLAEPDDFLRIYTDTFARQGIALDEAKVELVRSIVVQAVEGGYGRLSSCTTSEGIASMYLFLYDKKRAYHLFAANDPSQRSSGAATKLMFDNIFEAKRRGLNELDFVGVNSPNRGDFKLSFNPQLKLYFDLSYVAIDSTQSTGASS